MPTPAANNAIDNDVGEKESKDFKEKKEEKGGDADDMAPQVMLDENGDVVINEQRYHYVMLCYEFLSRIASSVLKVNCYQRGSCVGGTSAFNSHLDTVAIHTTSAH